MYKVNPEDVIPTRTFEEIEANRDKLCGSNPKAAKKARVLTSQFMAIARNITNENALDMVALAYRISDLANVESTKNAVCAKGCSHCCQVNVDVTALEVAYIEEKTGHKSSRIGYTLPAGSKLVPYCPFHNAETSLCDIWEHRPMACRGFFAFDDPKLCEGNDITHAVSNAWNIPATKQMMEVLKECGSGEVGDIRSYFKRENNG